MSQAAAKSDLTREWQHLRSAYHEIARGEAPSPFTVECLRLGKTYPPDVAALHNASLSAAPGEIIFITGASGAGKSTLLKLICRREEPSNGMVMLFGRDLARIKGGAMQRLRRQIGVAYQDFRLLPQLRVLENVAMALEVDHHPRRFIHRRVGELLEQLNLAGKERRRVAALSLGEQQRVAIARAAANHPRLLLADEPTGNLDHRSGALVLALFRELAADGSTIIVATHDEKLYQSGEHRVIHLERGVLTEVSKP